MQYHLFDAYALADTFLNLLYHCLSLCVVWIRHYSQLWIIESEDLVLYIFPYQTLHQSIDILWESQKITEIGIKKGLGDTCEMLFVFVQIDNPFKIN